MKYCKYHFNVYNTFLKCLSKTKNYSGVLFSFVSQWMEISLNGHRTVFAPRLVDKVSNPELAPAPTHHLNITGKIVKNP